MAHVFISYKREDKALAKELKQTLDDNGIPVWWDEEIYPGDKWEEMIDQAIEDSAALIVVLTSNALKSHWITYEWAYALFHSKAVFPLDFEGLNPNHIHEKLRKHQVAQYAETEQERLIKRLKEINTRLPASTIHLPANASPAIRRTVAELDNPDSVEQAKAIQTLSQMPDPIGVDILAQALRHSFRSVRVQSAIMLAQEHNDNRAKPVLIEALLKGWPPSDTVAVSLGMIGDNDDAKVLLEGLKNAPNGVYREISGALVQIASRLEENETIVDGLIDALRNSDPYIREIAAASLGYIRNDKAVIWLKDIINDQDEHIRRAVVSALRNIGTPHAQAIIKTWESDQKH